jgi:hypothetical protein
MMNYWEGNKKRERGIILLIKIVTTIAHVK